MDRVRRIPRVVFAVVAVVLVGLPPGAPTIAPVLASHTANPTSVTIAGSLQSELGCSGDWQPDCAATHLAYDATDDVWQATFTLPAGSWEYKAALNDSWNENYGANAQSNGSNIAFTLASPGSVKFYYDHKSHWATDNRGSRIVTAPGDFQSDIGCPGDWQPDCLRSWLEDADADGTFTFSTTSIPVGSYEAKAAINESWGENYGGPGGANIPFSVAVAGSVVDFSFVSSTNVLTISVTAPSGHFHDNNIEWDGVRHDSRDLLYRTPGGAVPAGTPVTIRLRTFHNDVTSAKLRVYSLNDNAQHQISMSIAASDVSCYQADLVADSCDFWQATLPNSSADNIWYRFIVTDGSDTDYYADNTPALDGGLGAVSDDAVDNSFALTVYQPGFTAPSWASKAVIYQIFPDRFRNGRANNDPNTGDVRYDDPALALPWGTPPEGYCRNYGDADTNCPWRFDTTPPADSPTKEQPRGRDYMGGDLKGVDQQLGYLASLGVNTIYFNPIFDSASNHGYDTQDYTKIDPYFGTQKDWDNLVKHADQLGVRIIVDGVFNHVSSDSPYFDRYHHFSTSGACESPSSLYRSWFHFHDVTPGTGTCASSSGVANGATYDAWFGFDSLPVLDKSVPAVQSYFLTAPNSVSKLWLQRGASGWRLDVSGDASFPDGYWQTFRSVVKAQDPNALTISESWQKDSTLLRMLRGDRLDTTMNYRLRDAVIALLAPGTFDSKGFADSGHVISPAEFAARMASQREDYADAAYYSLMNLLDSHDTERVLWTLTPGAETTAAKELNAANLAEGKKRLELASLIQFTVPGAPTVYYGDEVGVTGDDDPDDRRTFPWADLGGTPDNTLKAHYQALASLRKNNAALTDGDFRILFTGSNSEGTVAYGRRTNARAAIVAINRSNSSQTLAIPVAGFVPNGTSFSAAYAVDFGGGGPVSATAGVISITLPALSGVVLATGTIDLQAPAAPANLHVTNATSGEVSLAWNASTGAAGYNVYRSPLTGGGYVRVNGSAITGTTFTDTGLDNGRTYFYVVTALDANGNESGWSNEASATPHLSIGWANLQYPPTLTHTISATTRTDNIYGQVWIDGATNQPGPTPTLRAQAGFGPVGSNPDGNGAWTWVEASFNTDVGNNDEFVASFLPETTGNFDYVYRYTTTNGADWLYADLNGPISEGNTPPNPGKMTVNASSDMTAPATPTGLHVVSASPDGIALAWDPISGDPTLYGYEVRKSATAGGPYTTLALVTGTDYTDTDVTEGATYYYVVRSVDTSFNRSGNSSEVSAMAELRSVSVTFSVTVPATTDATGFSVHIAGTLSRLAPPGPDWDPSATALTRVDATHWTITLTGIEGTQLEYKYALGDWEHVEKDSGCGEIGNRLLTLTYGSTGTQTVNDVVLNWRNVAPCGN